MKFLYGITVLVMLAGCKAAMPLRQVNRQLQYCEKQVAATLAADSSAAALPRSIDKGMVNWRYVNYHDWTSGFWPGILWYMFEYTHKPRWQAAARLYTSQLKPLAYQKAYDHDIGYQVNCSFGNGYRLTGDTAYKSIIMAAADTLTTLFNPHAGTILSWPREVKRFGAHNTIMDNMINLELLFNAGRYNGNGKFGTIAVTHANTTMHNQFRPDYSSYHVVLYDSVTGLVLRRITHQGYSDSSMWARGQSWAVYGFTLCYRATGDTTYLHFAQHTADKFLSSLPADMVPYWDFNDPQIPNAPKDASAAAITASALLELSTYVTDAGKAAFYCAKARLMLKALSSGSYQSRRVNNALLLHSTGHKPNGTEIDASIIYADYYYVEALLRLKKLLEGRKNIIDPL